jgi:hypothetical protein
MAIRKPYGAEDVFATPEEATRESGATITDIPLGAFEESRVRPEVQELIRAAATLGPEDGQQLPALQG